MDISIVIVSYNTKELTLKCLKTLDSATKNLKAEIFIVDNNSEDNTAQAISKQFPRVHLIANRDNRGFAKASNQALKKAKGKYILVLNPDTEVLPDTLVKMIAYLKSKPKAAIATCRVELASGKLDADCRRHFPTPWRAFCHFSSLYKIFPKSKLFDGYYMNYLPENLEHQVDACVGAFMLIKKEAIARVGLFDESFFFYGEDIDWCWRFREHGYEIWFTPITKILHYKGAASGIQKTTQTLTKATIESKRRVLKESTRAMVIFYKKHYADRYPIFITWPILAAIRILEFIRLGRLKK